MIIEYQYADNNRDRQPELAAELARLKVDVIINLKASKQIGLTIPVRVLERANQVIK